MYCDRKRQKKTPEVSTPQGSRPSRSDAPSPSYWCSSVRSGRTVRRGGEDRSWFGRPQATKKAAGSAARNKGTNASKTLGLPAAPPSSGSQWCRGCRLRTAKKRSGPTRSQFDASSPHRREHQQVDRRNTYWSSPLRPNDYSGEQLKKKQRSHPLPVFDAFTPLQRVDLILAIHAYAAIRRCAH